MNRATPTVHQIRITLRHIWPPIWRRVLVPSSVTVDGLHDVIQAAMGWQDYHLYILECNGVEYARLDEIFELGPMRSARSNRLRQLAPTTPATLTYTYDLGDNWEHDLEIEDVAPAVPGERYPMCVKGRRACPPEDVGGTSGYDEFLRAIEDPDHFDHETMIRWSGGRFDPEEFSPEPFNDLYPRRILVRPDSS